MVIRSMVQGISYKEVLLSKRTSLVRPKNPPQPLMGYPLIKKTAPRKGGGYSFTFIYLYLDASFFRKTSRSASQRYKQQHPRYHRYLIAQIEELLTPNRIHKISRQPGSAGALLAET